MRESLPRAELKAVRRYANKSLWKGFVFQRDHTVAPQNNDDPNVKLLFHGTDEPSRILGSGLQGNCHGFDPRLSRAGAYGVGAYFATHAIYPVSIFPRCKSQDGTFDLIVAEVACGSVFDYQDEVNDTTRQLKRPPAKHGPMLHNSVRGTENSIGTRPLDGRIDYGEQYIVYEKTQAYPHFLITLAVPPTAAEVKLRFSGPHATMYLRGYADGGSARYSSLQDAQLACLSDQTASGITLDPRPQGGIMYGDWIGREVDATVVHHVSQELWIFFLATQLHTKMVAATPAEISACIARPDTPVGTAKVVEGTTEATPEAISAAWDEGLTEYRGANLAQGSQYLLRKISCMYTVRRGESLNPSQSGETSWMKAPRGVLYGEWVGREREARVVHHVSQELWIFFLATQLHTKMVAATPAEISACIARPDTPVGTAKVVEGKTEATPEAISAAWDEGLTEYNGANLAQGSQYLLKKISNLDAYFN